MIKIIIITISLIIAFNSNLFADRVIKFNKIGQRESVKMGERYTIVFDNLNPENSRIRYIPSARDDEYYLEITHYTGLENDKWVSDLVKNYEKTITELETKNRQLSEQFKKDSLKLLTSDEKTNVDGKTKKIDESTTGKEQEGIARTNKKDKESDYSIFNLQPLETDIDIKQKNIETIDKDIERNKNQFEANRLRIDTLKNNLINFGGDKKSASQLKSYFDEIEELLKKNTELSNANELLYNEKLKLYESKNLKERELESQIRLRNLFIILAIAALILAVIYYLNYKQKKKINKIIEAERQKSDNLLLNILPSSIAERLKKGETLIADYFKEASVVFIDISHFTEMVSKSKPQQVIKMLNKVYTEFDHVAKKYELEKIKTIGDCYMAASGIPEPSKEHSINAARFTLEAFERVSKLDFGDGIKLRFKAGIDCGEVIAGIIGEKKFIYDIWGNTVNTASRMEESSMVDLIQVTERFRDSLLSSINERDKNSFEINFKERGEIDIKGLGKMKTWFLTK